MDNKRKLVGSLVGKGTSKLRKIELGAFEDDDDVQHTATATGIAASSGLPNASSALDEEQMNVITKTAQWLFNNPDKSALLLEKSRDNPTMAFLQDTKGETGAGRFYLRELGRFRAEKEVAAVCSAEQPGPAIQVSTNQIAAIINAHKLAHNLPGPLSATEYQATATKPERQIGVTFPSHGTPAASQSGRDRRNRWGPPVDQPPIPPSLSMQPAIAAPGNSSGTTKQVSSGSRGGSGTRPSEAEEIAQLAASFDRTPAEDRERLERQLQEQREMQLLESRIRDAAAQGYRGGSGGDHGNVTEVAKFLAAHASDHQTNGADGDPYAPNAALRKGPALLIAEKQAALYLERLAQYEELARLEDDKYRDTVEECERNGGVIEGGTWEHRKRAKEMLTTAAKNLELTLLGAGKHHMADYLPPEVLQSFLRNAQQVTGGSGSGTSAGEVAGGGAGGGDGQQGKIDASNVGFQLLKKSGWVEGAGLGAQGTGITTPISAMGSGGSGNGAVTVTVGGGSSGAAGSAGSGSGGVGSVVIAGGRGPEGSGIGVRATHEVEAGDSEFEQYRKRMMLAYRFRPNPLNNPRRNYY